MNGDYKISVKGRVRQGMARAAAIMLLVTAATLLGSATVTQAGIPATDPDFTPVFGFADARLMGMGYSYTAVLDGPNPLYSNPASFGLAEKPLTLTLGAGWGDDAAADNFKFLSISDIDRGAGAGGFAWGQYRWLEGEQSYSGNTLNYMVGKQLGNWAALGMGMRYLKGGAAGDPGEVPSWRGLATDAGFVVKYSGLSLGVVVRDVTTTKLSFEDGTTKVVPPTYSCGLSLRPTAGLVIALDAHDIPTTGDGCAVYSGGFEGWLSSHFAVRGGVIVGDGANREATAYTGGIGLRFGDFELAYALLSSENETKRQCITLSRRF